jgi:hypothetical protein
VVATLAQLRLEVKQAGPPHFSFCPHGAAQKLAVPFENGTVILLLNHGQLHVYDGFLFLWNALLHILLNREKNTCRTPPHKRTDLPNLQTTKNVRLDGSSEFLNLSSGLNVAEGFLEIR